MHINTVLISYIESNSVINYQLVASCQRSVCVKIDRNSKKKDFPILSGNTTKYGFTTGIINENFDSEISI